MLYPALEPSLYSKLSKLWGQPSASYTVIAGILGWIVYRNRQALPFDWVVLAFGLFIVACGLTHVMHVITRVTPLYWLDGYVRGLTAVVSLATAAALPPLVPRVTALLSAERTLVEQQQDLERVNVALQEAAERSDLLAALGDALQGAQTDTDVQLTALDRLGPALGATSMLVALLDGQQARPTVVWGVPTGRPAELVAQDGFDVQQVPVLARSLQAGSATYLNEGQHLPGVASSLSGAYGLEPIFNAAGQVTGGVAAWRPAGQAWRAGEQDLLRRAAATVGLALERTQALSELARQHEALSEANRNLERSNADLDRFASIASHDLKAPIRAVTSFAELLSARYAPHLEGRGLTYLTQIRTNGYHMERLVDDLLLYSRAAVTSPAFAAVDTATTVQNVLTRLKPDLEGDVTVTLLNLPAVQGDAAQLDRLFQNLLSNALKYRKPDPLQIIVRAQAGPDHTWQFDVQDNGQGIEPEYHQRIFQLFARLHHREVDGTGLGLAICRRIVQHHGGDLWVESTPGQCSTFSFTLPRLPQHA
ncbi:sensor histidine kinase [Deinococcus kurensis]|uniref:sensor histidine kinase n=1 Tax=Deinococcus kurensis TaxID=2662757 RepID=UPI0012D34D3F|nr:ATP-binding protein [Deinococcus kurensis]